VGFGTGIMQALRAKRAADNKSQQSGRFMPAIAPPPGDSETRNSNLKRAGFDESEKRLSDGFGGAVARLVTETRFRLLDAAIRGSEDVSPRYLPIFLGHRVAPLPPRKKLHRRVSAEPRCRNRGESPQSQRRRGHYMKALADRNTLNSNACATSSA